MKIALRQQMPHQDRIAQPAHLAGGLLHPSDFLKIEKSLILRHVEIAKRPGKAVLRAVQGGIRTSKAVLGATLVTGMGRNGKQRHKKGGDHPRHAVWKDRNGHRTDLI